MLTLVAGLVEAAPVQWKVEDGGNGHWYEAVLVGPGGISWSDAKTAAQAADGYLATITSSQENVFVYGLVSTNSAFWYLDGSNNGIGPWLGGYQPDGSPEPDGDWRWVTGEAWSYANWASSEPNNLNGEDYLQFFGRQSLMGSTWNDYPDIGQPGEGPSLGYIVEYGMSPGSSYNSIPITSFEGRIVLGIILLLIACGYLLRRVQPEVHPNR